MAVYPWGDNSNEIIRDAIFSDGSERFLIPMEPMPGDTVTVRLRVACDNIDSAECLLVDGVLKMSKALSSDIFDYYEASFKVTDAPVYYSFRIKKASAFVYFTMIGVLDELNPDYRFRIFPGYKTPDWAKGAVFYQIYIDRFAQGDITHNVLTNEYSYIGEGTVEVTDWYKYPASMGVREFYGGDIAGVIKKFDYLSELGVEVLYLNPIFVSPSNHKYDIQDYDYVDPHIGVIVSDGGECLAPGDNDNTHATKYIKRVTDYANLEASNDFFAFFVAQAHKRGIKVILDGVFNHCGSFNKWLDRERIYEFASDFEKGAFVSKDSPYNTFFDFNQDTWPYNTHYDGWWGNDTLPKLNYEGSDKLYEYILDIAKKWVSPPFAVDGWRLDVAADLGHSSEFNHKFWRDFRKAVREANPEALILAEHYGDPSAWLSGDQWDTVMNYDAFMEPLTWFLTGVEKHSDSYRGDLLCNQDAFFGSMRHYMSRFNMGSLLVAMNELSNHDHSRFLTRTNHKVGRTATVGCEAADSGINLAIMREAVMIQMTWPGAPTIYYGDEAGVCGWTDPDSRRTYPWDRENLELIWQHKELIKIHKAYQALRTGSIKFLYSAWGVISYGRFDDRDQFVVIVNNNPFEASVDVPVWQIGISGSDPLVRMAYTNEMTFGVDCINYWPENGRLRLKMYAYSSLLLFRLGDI